MAIKQKEWLTDQQKLETQRLYSQGCSVNHLVSELGLEPKYVAHIKNYLKEIGIYQPTIRGQYLKEHKDEILDKYKSGMSVRKICKEIRNLGYTVADRKIIELIKKSGLELRFADHYNKKYKVNKQAFSSYTLESCYWARLLAADGCVHRRGKLENSQAWCTIISLVNDRDTLENFKNFLEYEGSVHSRISKGKTINTLCIDDYSIAQDLINNFNITPRKTLTFTPNPNIPEEYRMSFLLGYLDGGGSIGYYTPANGKRGNWKGYQINVTRTSEMIEFIKAVLEKPNLKKCQRFPERQKNNWTITIQGNQQVLTILKKIYGNDRLNQICMKRKYNKYLEIMDIEKTDFNQNKQN